MDKWKTTEKHVTFENEGTRRTMTNRLRFTAGEEEFVNKVEEWATVNKKLTEWMAHDDCEKEPDEDGKLYDKMVREKPVRQVGDVAINTYENRLMIVQNIPKLPTNEHLTGVDNYDGWNTEMRFFFVAFDVTEYVEEPLHEVSDAQKIQIQLDAAILLAIHGNISTVLQQVVNNEVHAFEAWETLQKLCTGNTIQELTHQKPYDCLTDRVIFFYQAFDPVRQWPHHGPTDRFFFYFFSKSF